MLHDLGYFRPHPRASPRRTRALQLRRGHAAGDLVSCPSPELALVCPPAPLATEPLRSPAPPTHTTLAHARAARSDGHPRTPDLTLGSALGHRGNRGPGANFRPARRDP